VQYNSVEAQQNYLCMVAPLSVDVQPPFRGISCPQLSKFQVSLGSEIQCQNRLFEFHKPIELLLYQDNGVWVCECCEIMSVGSSSTEAALSFCEDFSVLWDEIAQLPDSALTKGAQEMKSCILSIVKSVR